MGGKSKSFGSTSTSAIQQRSKNNSRPSSSGRSAELLTNSLPTSFLGFSTMAGVAGADGTFSPILNFQSDNSLLNEEFEKYNIDLNYQNLLRKMTKKDPITKVKALNEFIDMIQLAEIEEIKTILPFWPRIYVKLAIDADHRVRETCQQTNSTIVTKSGKNIAPHLKNLAPAWIASGYDSYAPAASIATTSFTKSFPSHKLQEVFAFCQNEILDFVIKNLTIFTPTTLTNSKSNTPEECEAIYQRSLICSLKCYSLYLSKINENQIKETIDKQLQLIDNTKFWNYHKHKIISVRSAWFEVLTSLLQYASFLLDKHESPATNYTIQHIDEIEPIVLPYVWSAMLLIQVKFENWHKHVNIEKAFLPKLWKTLKNGGEQNASIIYPHLLPLLSKLPASLIFVDGDKIEKFYMDFFDNLKIGLQKDNVKHNRSNITAISSGYYECLRYLIKIIDIDSSSNEIFNNNIEKRNEFCLKLIDQHILQIIQWCFEQTQVRQKQITINKSLTTSSTIYRFIFPQLILILEYLQQNANLSQLQNLLIKHFWNEIYQIFEKTLNMVDDADAESNDNMEKLIESQIEFFCQLKQTNKQKIMKVKFQTKSLDNHNNIDSIDGIELQQSTTNICSIVETQQNHNQQQQQQIVKTFDDQLNEFTYKLCCFYMRKVNETQNILFILNIEKILKNSDNEILFKKLAVASGGGGGTGEGGGTGKISKLYDKFAVWLLMHTIRIENIIDIILCLYKYLEKNEKNDLLNKLMKFPNEKVQFWTLKRILSYPLCTEVDVIKLIKQSNVTDLLIKCAESIVSADNTKENINLLHKCFFQNENGDILIDQKTCEKIIEIISTVLFIDNINEIHDNIEIPEETTTVVDDNIPTTVVSHLTTNTILDSCASFLAQIMPVICGDEQKKTLQMNMFLNFFKFSLIKNVSDDLSEDTLWEITTSWQDALSSNDLQLNDDMLEKCTQLINDVLMENQIENQSSLTIQSIENISEIVSKLITCSIEQIDNELEKLKMADKILLKVFNENFKIFNENLLKFENYCLFIESINSSITNITTADGDDVETSESTISLLEILNLLKLTIFKFTVLFKITCNIKKKQNQTLSSVTSVVTTSVTGVTDEISQETNYTEESDECTEDFCDLDVNLLKTLSDSIIQEILKCFYIGSLADCLLNDSKDLHSTIEDCIIHLTEIMDLYIENVPIKYKQIFKENIIKNANKNGLKWASSLLYLLKFDDYKGNKDGMVLLLEDTTSHLLEKEIDLNYINILQVITKKIAARSLPMYPTLLENHTNFLLKIISRKCLIKNYFENNLINEYEDKRIVESSKLIIIELCRKSKLDKSFLLYNENISKVDMENIILPIEIANFLVEVINSFPAELDIAAWDFIRLALSSWVLTVSKSSDNFQSTKVLLFTSSIYNLFGTFSKFIINEKQKSSTKLYTDLIDEWEKLFAKDVNLILLKCYMKFINQSNYGTYSKVNYFLDGISKIIYYIDFKYTLLFKIDSQTTTDSIINFALNNLIHKMHSIRTTSVLILKRLTSGLIEKDIEINLKYEQDNGSKIFDFDSNAVTDNIENTIRKPWQHLLIKFHTILVNLTNEMNQYCDVFSFKTSEIEDFTEIPKETSIPYLLLWDCILHICSKAPSEQRSIYVNYLTGHKFEQTIFKSVFRLMPCDLLRNTDIKSLGQSNFIPLQVSEILSSKLSPPRYACHIYIKLLKILPAIVRKCWNDTNTRGKNIIDKLTTNYISEQLIQDEFKSLTEKRDKQKNLQINVRFREIIANYILNDACIDLKIILPINYPLGQIKIDSDTQIGSRLQARELVMQLTIFLTHQNGNIWDGLMLWKKHLDRKFEGVEECYICYSVIHQDTCQLPRLTCKSCKKKFHAPCLYKWFSTSNKSTCPLCRNLF